MLTGSTSKRKYALYYYYHCVSSCGCRYNAAKANEAFTNELKKFVPHDAVVNLYKEIIKSAHKKQHAIEQNGTKQILTEINKFNDRLAKARNLLLSEDIGPDDYRIIKKQ